MAKLYDFRGSFAAGGWPRSGTSVQYPRHLVPAIHLCQFRAGLLGIHPICAHHNAWNIHASTLLYDSWPPRIFGTPRRFPSVDTGVAVFENKPLKYYITLANRTVSRCKLNSITPRETTTSAPRKHGPNCTIRRWPRGTVKKYIYIYVYIYTWKHHRAPFSKL